MKKQQGSLQRNSSRVIASMSSQDIGIAIQAEEEILNMPNQVLVPTHHTLHGGVYTRTIKMNEGEILSGALIKVATTLIVQGELSVYIGSEVNHLEGYSIIPALKNRKQVMYARGDCWITMIIGTSVKSVEEAEEEFTDDYLRLMSRLDDSVNTYNITGE